MKVLYALLIASSQSLRYIQKPSQGGEVLWQENVLSEEDVRAKLQKSTVVFMLPLGPARNQYLPYVRANIEKIGGLFHDFSVVIGTPEGGAGESEALKWKKEAQSGECSGSICHPEKRSYNLSIATNEASISVTCPMQKKPCRAGRGRDAILQNLLEKEDKPDFAIAVDSDMVKQWNERSFLKAFSLDGDWAMVAANGQDTGTGKHTDWLAYKSRQVYARDHRFDPNDSAFQVTHAFGGVSVYQTKALLQCKYSPGFPCEHWTLEDCLAKNGGKVYMHPGFVIEWNMKRGSESDIIKTWKCAGDKICDATVYWKN